MVLFMFGYLYDFMVEILIRVIFMFNFNILGEVNLNYLNIKKFKKYLFFNYLVEARKVKKSSFYQAQTLYLWVSPSLTQNCHAYSQQLTHNHVQYMCCKYM